jgi:tetratricopeptide (TPR) repeat protein
MMEVENMCLRFAEVESAGEKALAYAKAANNPKERTETLNWLMIAATYGPLPVDEGLDRCDALASEAETNLWMESLVAGTRGRLLGMKGQFADARTGLHRAVEIYSELGEKVFAASSQAQGCAAIEVLAGDLDAAERLQRSGNEQLKQLGARSFRSTVLCLLAETMYRKNSLDEAEALTMEAESIGDDDDVATQAGWRAVRAKVLARRGMTGEAEALAREAASLAEQTSDYLMRPDVFMDLAEVLAIAGRTDEAIELIHDALRLYEKKGNLVSAERARRSLASMARAT